MAVDQALLDDAERAGRAHLRLYGWNPACLSFGRNEPALERYDRDLIQRSGVAVVRRPTGGHAVWHEHELTYAVTAPIARFGSLRAAYQAIHQRLAAALRMLGVPVELAGPQRAPPPSEAGACFSSAAGGELLIRGRKVAGSAQVRQGQAFLQHGSILIDGSQGPAFALAQPPLAGRRHAATGPTTLREALGRQVTFAELADAVVREWASHEPVTGLAGPVLTLSAHSRFGSPGWIWRR